MTESRRSNPGEAGAATRPGGGRKPASGRRSQAPGAWIFAACALGVLAATRLAVPRVGHAALILFGRLTIRVLPVLLVVFGLMFLFRLWGEPGGVRRRLGRGGSWWGWLAALAGGILSMGPIFAWYSFLAELRRSGMRPGLAAVFLYARAIKLPMLPMFLYYFGSVYVGVLTAYMVLASLAAGWLTERFTGRDAP